MRTRTKGSLTTIGMPVPVPITTTNSWCAKSVNGQCVDTRTSSTVYNQGASRAPDFCTITDDDTYKYKDAFKRCSHTKWVPFDVTVNGATSQTGLWTGSGTPRPHKCTVPTFGCKWSSTYLPFSMSNNSPAIDWAALVMEVGDSLSGDMTSESNLIVTLAEAAETIGMIKHPLSFLKAIRHGASIKNVLQAVSAGHLTYKYGWRQLHSDIVAFGTMKTRIDEHLSYLEDHKGVYRPLSASSHWSKGGSAYSWSQSVGRVTFRADEGRYDRYARFSLRSRLDDAVFQHAKRNAWISALGVDKICEATWDLVPFSFVVDWLVDWRAFRNDPKTLYANHAVKRMGYSISETWSFKPSTSLSTPNLWDGTPGPSSSWVGSTQVVKSVYERYPGFPPGCDNVGLFKRLSKTNLVDAAALMLQRL